jgi:PhoH-like ATPase
MPGKHGMKDKRVAKSGGISTPPTSKTSKKNPRATNKHVKQSIPTRLRSIEKTGVKVITYVLDTNVIMTAWDALFKFEEHNVYITGQVWAELDKYKKGNSPEAYNVRQAIRYVDDLLKGKTTAEIKAGITLTPPPEHLNGKPHTGKLFFDFSEPKLTTGMNLSLDTTHPDDRIILTCLGLKKPKNQVVLISNDGSCRVKARIVGLEAEEYLSDTVSTVEAEETLSPGFHHMPTDFMNDSVIDCKSDKGHAHYTLKHEALDTVAFNEFLIIPENKPLRVVSRNEDGSVEAESLCFHDQIKEMALKTRNLEQELAVQLLLNTAIPAMSLAGLAGSGKTYLTLAVGLQLMKKGVYDRIIFTRSMQGSDEEIGFLPGDEAEKMGPWMGALWDNVSTLLGIDAQKPLEQQTPANQKILQQIKVVSLNFMKGRSINKTLIIVDESQDLAPKALKMISTRVGNGSKIVFLGNTAQIDNPNLTQHTCGLSVFIRTLRDEKLTGHVTLQKGERSPFATLAEQRL